MRGVSSRWRCTPFFPPLLVKVFTQYSITEVWSVSYVGTIVNGILNAGSIKTGDVVLMGSDANGSYQPTAVKSSMQRKRLVMRSEYLEFTDKSYIRADVTHAEAGQCVSIALKRMRGAQVRKGMVLVTKTDTPREVCR